jgi:glycosyltransferase involved in cell wall biosynthesis
VKFTIVSISYSQAQFLEQAMRSVIEQDGVSLEYIVVDPGSTDGSREIIERCRDRLATVIFERDRGPADGLNKGFAAATGDIFGFLNSDDYLLPGSLAKVRRYFQDHPRIDVVSGHGLIVDGLGRVLRRNYSDRFSARMEALGAASLVQQSTFFRAPAFRAVGGFNAENKVAWDGELFFRMHRKGAKFGIIDELLSAWRIHEAGITGSARLDQGLREYRNRMFREYYGRNPNALDRVRMGGARLVKHLRNLRGVRERLLHGPIYGRARPAQAR